MECECNQKLPPAKTIVSTTTVIIGQRFFFGRMMGSMKFIGVSKLIHQKLLGIFAEVSEDVNSFFEFSRSAVTERDGFYF